jgi:hypothetical protein
MRVSFKVNLGSQDAELVGGLDFRKCRAGMQLEVSDEAGEWLVSHGIAEQLETTPKPIVGIAPKPAIAEAEAPGIQTTTSPGPKAGSKKKES